MTAQGTSPGGGERRSMAQFFFEVGYGACFADAMISNDLKPPFELTDAHIEAAFPRSIEAHEDGAEMDRYLAMANSHAALVEALRNLLRSHDTFDTDDWIDAETKARAALAQSEAE